MVIICFVRNEYYYYYCCCCFHQRQWEINLRWKNWLLALALEIPSVWEYFLSYQYLTSLGLPRDLAQPEGSCRLDQSCK